MSDLGRDSNRCWRCGVPLHPGHYCGSDETNPVVGHKTFRNTDGTLRHEPLLKDEAEELWKAAEAAKADRANKMPDEKSAIAAMFNAWLRLKELGWKEAIYCPKNGAAFKIIEAGSTGIFAAHYEGKWPDGYIISFDEHDSYVSRPGGPILFRLDE